MEEIVHVSIMDSRFLNIDYSKEETVKMLIKNWGKLERLAQDGDDAALCVLSDLERAVGIDISQLIDNKKAGFDASAAERGVLTSQQFISIVYVLGLGYRQEEIAYVLNCTKQVVNKHITRGVHRIVKFLGEKEEGCENSGKNKKKRRRSRRYMVKGS